MNRNVSREIVLRQLYMQRYARSVINKSDKESAKMEKKLLSLIRKFEKNMTPLEVRALSNGVLSNVKVRELVLEIRKLLNDLHAKQVAIINEQLASLAVTEQVFVLKIMGNSKIALVPTAKVLSAPILGNNVDSMLKSLNTNALRSILNSIIVAQQNGDPLDRNLVGSRDLKYKDSVLQRFRRNNASNINTMVTGVSNNARYALFNKGKVARMLVLATLDFRTTPICRARDEKVFDINEVPRPPYHYNCRTVIVPYTGFNIKRPFVKDKRSVGKIPPDKRKDKIGQTRNNYSEWFKTLSKEDKIEILGPSRYKLYSDGKITMDQFVDTRSGHVYTLDELDKLY